MKKYIIIAGVNGVEKTVQIFLKLENCSSVIVSVFKRRHFF